MKRLAWIRTAPPDLPGSMAAFAEMVSRGLSANPSGWEMSFCDLFDPRGGTSMWEQHLWRLKNARRILAAHPADLYHWLDGSMAAFIPRELRKRSVVTVHDLIPLRQLRGELPGKPSLPAAGIILRGLRALRECAGVCAVSQATRADLARLAGIERGVEVVLVSFRSLPSPAPLTGFDLPAKFIFHLGNNAPYKNRIGVAQAFAHLRDCEDLHLVLAGPPMSPELRAAVAGLDRVHLVGPVADDQLAWLYRHATLLLFPSRYEGYGSPVLEAMALGCPVVCSTAPSLVEVAGPAALFAPAEDAAALAVQCRRLLSDDCLRREQIACGLARAAAFDVASMGRSLMKWYEQAHAALEKKESHA